MELLGIGLLKKAEWVEKQKIPGFASIPSPNGFDLGWGLAGTLKFEKLHKKVLFLDTQVLC